MAIDKVEYWRELADYDIETAEVMYGGGRWLYVGFMCHQVIEKTIKAYWSKIKPDEVPFIHNLLKLAQSCGLVSKMSPEQLRFIAELMPMNIEARYPSYKEELAKKLTPDYCRTIIDKTRELKLWIEKQL
ncbi:MAG TPA: DNA-binding protein [Prevotella sp.]|nr:DNA-binding protein [Prevotella sp.]